MKTKVLLLLFAMAVLPFITISQTWYEVGKGGFSVGEAYLQRIAYDGNTIYAAYIDNGDANKLSVKKYNGTNWEFVGSQGFTPQLYSFDFVIENGQFFIAFETSTKVISVMTLAGGQWNYVGDTILGLGFSASLAVNASIPYVAYTDWENGNKVSVKKPGSNGWEYVGVAGFSPFTLPGILDIEVSGSSVYIAARDESYGYDLKATVMKYDGTQWDTVGNRGFSGSTLDAYNPLAIYNGVPYVVAWNDQSQGAVYKYNGTNWVTVGSAISQGLSYYENLKVSPQGNLYIAFTDAGKTKKAELKKFNGSTWESIGGEISQIKAKYLDIAFDNTETPYMVFQDSWYLRKTTVMTFGEVVDGIENHSSTNDIVVYPNPVNEILSIKNNTNSTINEILIYNQLGQQVSRSTIPIFVGAVLDIDVSKLGTGIYFVRINAGLTSRVKKLIVR